MSGFFNNFYNNKVRRNFTVYNIFLASTVILFTVVRLRHINIAFERDEGEYAYAGQEILRGGLPFKDFYNMKMPGVYYIMAILFKFFGDSVAAVRISLLCVNYLSAFFIFLTTRKFFDKNTGVAAAAIFLLYCLSYSAQGWTANAEHYVVMFGCAGLFFTVLARQKNQEAYLFPAGILMMLAFICKQHGIGYLLFPFIWMLYIGLWTTYFKRDRTKNSHLSISDFQIPTSITRSLLYYVAGACLPFGIMLLYFWKMHILPNFYFLTFRYADAYAAQQPPLINIWHFRPIFWDNFGFWFLSFAFIYFSINKKIFIRQFGFFPILFLCSLASISLGWYYRPHYFQLFFPVAAIMSAWMLVRLRLFWNFRWLTPAGYILLAFAATCIMQFDYFFAARDEIMVKMYGPSYFNEKKIIGAQISGSGQNSKDIEKSNNPKILVFGCEPQIFFYARQESANGFMYMFPLLEYQRFAPAMIQQFITETETAKPEMLIYFPDINDLAENESQLTYLKKWFAEYSNQYNIVAQSYLKNGVSVMDWHTENQMRVCLDSTIALIYKRK